MGYSSETDKFRPIVLPHVHLPALDLGCGPDKIVPNAIGVDSRPLPGVTRISDTLHDISTWAPNWVGAWKTVYSSHCLEHLPDDAAALRDWESLLTVGGKMCLYLPDQRRYESLNNPEHLQVYLYPNFLKKFCAVLPNMKLIAHGEHFGDDLYSFYVIAEKQG